MPKFTPPLCANELRYLAEKADGWRDTALTMVITKGKVDVKPSNQVTGEDKELFTLKTPSRGKGVAGDAKARVFWNNKNFGGPDTDLEKADAVFLTQSAIEKFLLPYYMRFKSGAEVQGLENRVFNDKNVAAVFHIPPSIPKVFPGPVNNGDDGHDSLLVAHSEIVSVGIVGSVEPSGEVVCESFENWCSLVDQAGETRVAPEGPPAGVTSDKPR